MKNLKLNIDGIEVKFPKTTTKAEINVDFTKMAVEVNVGYKGKRETNIQSSIKTK